MKMKWWERSVSAIAAISVANLAWDAFGVALGYYTPDVLNGVGLVILGTIALLKCIDWALEAVTGEES